MAVQIPTWLIGKFVTGLVAVSLSADSQGNLTTDNTFAMTGLLDEITPTSTNDTENIVPLDVRQNNEVIVGSGSSLTLVEILNQQTGNQAPAGNCLQQIAFASDYMGFTFSRSGLVYTGYFVIGEYSEGIRRGKSVGTLSVKPCGIAVAYGS